MWDLPVQQSEVLKIGRFSKDETNLLNSSYLSRQPSDMTTLPDSSPKVDPIPALEGLDFQRHCASCGHPLKRSIFAEPPITPDTPSKRHRRNQSIRRCSNCKPRQPLPTKLPCVICGEVVDGMLIPCLSCGHVSCFECHHLWFLHPNSQTDTSIDSSNSPQTPTCPSGCGCNCSEHVATDVAMPSWEPLSPPQTRVSSPKAHSRSISHDKKHRRRQSEPAGPNSGGTSTPRSAVGQNENDLDIWETSSPFASLARGMGGGLSQGLSGRQDRKKNRSVALATPRRK